jgi:Flp pilus assembly protein TadD
MSKGKTGEAPKGLVNSALRLSQGDDLESAARALSSLAAEYPEDMKVQFAAGSLLFRMGRFAEAIPHFEPCVVAEPTNEYASVCLFVSFFKCSRIPEAREELRRFDAAGGESMEYRRLQRDLIRVMEDPEA